MTDRWAHWKRRIDATSPRTRDHLALATLLVISLFRGLLWIGAYPALKIADEPSHFDDIQFRAEHKLHAPRAFGPIADKVMSRTASPELRILWNTSQDYFRESFLRGRRVVPEEKLLEEMAARPEARATDGQSTSITYPGFYYALATVPYNLMRDHSVLDRVFAVRVYSLFWGLVLVTCTFFAARWCLSSRAFAFAAGLFASLQPVAAQQMIAVNNDAAVVGLCALVFLIQLAMLRRDSVFLFACLGAMLALALRTKPQALALVPGTLLLLTWSIAKAPRSRRTWIAIGASVVTLLVVAFGFSLLFDRPVGHILAESLPRASVKAPARGVPTVPTFLGFVKFLYGVDDEFFGYLFDTGWGVFCWLDLSYSPRWFEALHFGTIILWIGSAAAVARRVLTPRDRFAWDLRTVGFSLFTAVSGFVVVLFAEYYVRSTMGFERAIQGRAFLVVLPAFIVVGTVAVSSLVPRRFHTLAAAISILSMSLLAAGALITVVTYQYAK